MECYVGIDVAKASLAIATWPDDTQWTTSHGEADLSALLVRLQALTPRLIVLEATGGYEAVLAGVLATAGLPVVRAGGLLLVIGIVVGMGASRITNGLVLNNVVMGAAETDSTMTGVAAVGVIVVVGLAACLIPALRASKTSPMQALRQD